jgi:hypothetical protein
MTTEYIFFGLMLIACIVVYALLWKRKNAPKKPKIGKPTTITTNNSHLAFLLLLSIAIFSQIS